MRVAPFTCLTFLLFGCGPGEADESDPRIGHAESAVVICADGPTVEGIDVSGYQPDTNWSGVKQAGKRFAIIKATEGTGYVNPYFAQDWAGTKANGILRGAYHYFHPDTNAQAQAEHFLGVMGALGAGDLPAVLDFETDDGGVADATAADRAKQWLEIVEQATGKKPILYTYPSFWSSTLGSPPGFTAYPLWIANYGVSCPDVPGGWKKWPFWQYSSTGPVGGVQGGNVDKNVFNGTMEELQAFAGGGSPTLAHVSGNDSVTLVNSPADKATFLFARTTGGEMASASSPLGDAAWSSVEVTAGGTACGLAGAFTTKPKARGELFSTTDDGSVRRSAWSAEGWADPEDFAGQGLSRPSTLVHEGGKTEVFALGDDGAIHRRVSEAGTEEWSEWESLGGEDLVTGAAAILRANGHAAIFATDASNVAWHNAADASGTFAGWQALDGDVASRPVPVRWPDGHLEIFARGADDQLVHAVLAEGAWKPFAVLGEGTHIAGEPSAIMNPGSFGTAGAEVVARGTDGQVLHLWWLGEGYGDWSPHLDRRSESDPFLWVRGDGHAEVFAIDGEGQLHRSYHAKDGWAAWDVIASVGLDPCSGSVDGGSSSGAGPSGGSSGGDDDGDGAELLAGSDAGADESGCACRASTRDARGGGLALLAALAALLVRRRGPGRARVGRAAWLAGVASALLGCAGSNPVDRDLGGSGGAGGSGGEIEGAGGDDTGPGSGGSDAASTTGAGGAQGGCSAGVTCIDALPFHNERDTSQEGSKLIDFYECKPTADESGPEIVYRLEAPSAGTLTVTVTDGDGVDIDVHVLSELAGSACLARDDVSATAEVTAGVVWVVADTYVSGGVPQAGSYQLDVELVP